MERLGNRMANIAMAGRKALNLIEETGLGARLPAGLVENLKHLVDALSDLIPGAGTADTHVQALTATQEVACARAHRRISAIRSVVARQTKLLETRRSYGVGERTDPRLVRSIVVALRVILARIESHPEEATSFGIVEKDVVGLRAVQSEVLASDSQQERARVERPRARRERDAAVRGVIRAVGIVSDLGALEFADDEPRRRQFKSLRTRASSASTPDSAEETPEAEAEATAEK